MNTTDNKLIAEFMGMTCHHNDKSVLIFSTENGNDIVSIDDLKYHTDWNWLIPVVEKIENLGFEFFIVESRCKIAHNTDKSIEIIFGFELVGKKINAVYYNCIEFIKWYNNQNQ
jgi:hypothetical protein